ncbi:MAG: homocysteine S-methyltransferase, partial [Actinobacteria bacterium]|nr:homocysteine S-methyltransferase [Actinomycetota bacterium]
VDAGADLVAVETIPLADEARLIAEILEDLGAPPAWFSFGAASGSLTYGGDTLVSAVEAVTGYANLVAVGVNCAHPDVVDAAVETISGLSNGSPSAAPIIAYPNHGRSWDAASRQWVGVGVNSFETSRIEALVSRGATYIGGCCGVGAAGIARLVAIRDDAVA